MKPILSRLTRVSASSGSPASDSPSTRTIPEVGRSSPPTRLRSVDLPEPEGPMIDTISPRAIASVTRSRAVTCRLPANRLLTSSSSMTGGAGEVVGAVTRIYSMVSGFRVRRRAEADAGRSSSTTLLGRRPRLESLQQFARDVGDRHRLVGGVVVGDHHRLRLGEALGVREIDDLVEQLETR